LLDLKLNVHSEFGKGSAFSLLLPASTNRVKSPYVRSERTPACQPHVGEPLVLLVDDDQAVRDATRMLLSVAGYRVTAVASLTEALDTTRSDARFDLLITDYHLSEGETGLQVITALRERFGPALKAVLITADTSSAIKDLPLDPCLRIISKPISADELLTLLRELLAN
jgi:CheY-like chemotaxis protein